jgi:hypothetical protein
MRRLNWQVFAGIGLVVLTAVFALAHYIIFSDAHNLFFYLLLDVVFVPLEVLFVTLVINQLLRSREKRAMLNKLNMVIGAFFGEVGTGLLKRLAAFDRAGARDVRMLLIQSGWTPRDFAEAIRMAGTSEYRLDALSSDLVELRTFLVSKRGFLLRLLENPNLLEHEQFTDLLWAVFHLTEELAHRPAFDSLPGSDTNHLSGDMKRVYVLLVVQWLSYMGHLSQKYPYLYSLAVRTNPFDPNARVVVSG